MTDDPERLVTSTDDPELRRVLEAGRAELPTDAQLAALAARVGVAPGGGGPGGGPGGGAAARTSAAGSASLVKLVAGLLVAGGAAAVVAGAWPSPHPSPARAPAASAVEARTEAIDAAPPSEPTSAPEAAREAPPPPPRTATGPTVVSPTDDVGLLSRAEQVMIADPGRALSLADEYKRRFRDGILRQEADVVAIDALVRLGRKGDAEARAAAFRAGYPGSPHERRIAALLGASD